MRSLKRTLSLPMLTFYGVGMILGAGIYSVIGSAAGHAGHFLWISFVLAAICAALTAFSYAELSTMIPRAGSEYSFLRYAFPRFANIATASGILMAFSESVTAGAVALAFAKYLQQLTGLNAIVMAVFTILFFTMLNLFGTRESSRVNVVMTIIEIAGLVLFIGLAILSTPSTQSTPVFNGGGILSGAALILFAYLGFEDITNLVEDTKLPLRNIPRAIFWSLGISAVLYILVSLAALRLMSPTELAQSSAPLMDATIRSSPKAAQVLGVMALFATANTVLIILLAASRTLYGMARDHSIPAVLAKLNSRHTPTYGSLVVAALAIAVTFTDSVEFIASLASFTTLLNFVMINLTVIYLRLSKPRASRPFRIPWSIRNVPISAVLGAITGVIFLSTFVRSIFEMVGHFVSAAF